MSTQVEPSSHLRTIPVQRRSADRMDALLNAAAELIDEGGIDAVTTTAVAYRSGSSVGVLYRYFPNIDTLLRQLAARNLERYLAVVRDGSDMTPDNPWSSWDYTLDGFVTLCRNEPSFRRLRFGDLVTERFLSDEEPNNKVIAREFAEMVSKTHSVPVTKDMLFHLEIATAMGQALMTEAFRDNPRGDKRIIEQARSVIGDYLRTNIPIN